MSDLQFTNLVIDSRSFDYGSSASMRNVQFSLWGKVKTERNDETGSRDTVGEVTSCGWVECVVELQDFDVIIPAYVMGHLIKAGYGDKLYKFFKYNSGFDSQLFDGDYTRGAHVCDYGTLPSDVLARWWPDRMTLVLGLFHADVIMDYLDEREG